jgi:hypothetical protein
MTTLTTTKSVMVGGDIGDDDYDEIFDEYGNLDMKKKQA